MAPTTQVDAPRVGARVLLFDSEDRVLLIHARDSDQPDHHWWELPGGGLHDGETFRDAAIREVAEETGIVLDAVGPCLWIRESRFRYRNRDHHRIDHVFLAYTERPAPTTATKHTANERAGLIERRWLTAAELHACQDELLPARLPRLVREILDQGAPNEPIELSA